MQTIRQIFHDAPSVISMPEELQHHSVEVIFSRLDSSDPMQSFEIEQNDWVGFIEQTFGSIPDYPERESQGEFENREPFE